MGTDLSFNQLLASLRTTNPLTISRWGSQEWQLILGHGHKLLPANGYTYIDQLRCDLWNVLLSRPQYDLVIATEDRQATNAIFAAELSDLSWQRNPFEICQKSPQMLEHLVETCRAKPLIVVGPPKYRHLRQHLKWETFVDVPPKNVYLRKRDIVQSVLAALNDLKQPAVVTLSAGVCTPIIVHELFQRVGRYDQLLDVGKLWSAFESKKHF